MKKLKFLLTGIAISLLSGCYIDVEVPDTKAPSPPSGLYTEARDSKAYLDWNHSPERDVAGYKVWVSYSYSGRYELIGTTGGNYFNDKDARNGTTYYYAVSAYDYTNNESELSDAVAFATPRPEGFGVSINDYRTRPATAGYDFSTYTIGQYNDQYTDIFFEYYNGEYYMNVWNDTDIKDMGATNSLYDITKAPSSGWSATKDAILRVGRTYVVWTNDDHYAKFRVISISSTRAVFDWSYQLQKGNPYLKRNVVEGRLELKFGPGAEGRN
ncbi:MAG: hypothetical protein QME58_06775 [Bacteroidota bacterium]|nr:hypothetical protein [Bacteroidota bacterium]